jgi:hypothetical protein
MLGMGKPVHISISCREICIVAVIYFFPGKENEKSKTSLIVCRREA